MALGKHLDINLESTNSHLKLADVIQSANNSQPVKTGILFKHSLGGPFDWQPKWVILKENILLFLDPNHKSGVINQDNLRDFIYLHEIKSVEKLKNHKHQVTYSSIQAMDSLLSEEAAQRLTAHILNKAGEAAVSDAAALSDVEPSGNSQTVFAIRTREGSMNSGRRYFVRALNGHELDDWVEAIRAQKSIARNEFELQGLGTIQQLRRAVAHFFYKDKVQLFISTMIAANFVVNAIEVQFDVQDGSKEERTFFAIDVLFTTMFTVEVTLNLFINWFTHFWGDGWNILDFITISISILALALLDIPVLSSLRLLRVFRAVRLFRKLKSLRIIVNAIIGSMVPVLNSVVVLVIVTSMYAILGVQLYKDLEEDTFDNFYEALFTMYQVATGDSWAAAVARPMFIDERTNEFKWGDIPSVMLFFSSYTLITSMVLLNVVVAVLLDNFTKCVQQENAEHLHSTQVMQPDYLNLSSPLDPLLVQLTTAENEEHLSDIIHCLFEGMDFDGDGSLTYEEVFNQLRDLNVQPRIFLSADDYENLTENYSICEQGREVSFKGFDAVIRNQLDIYTEKQLSMAMSKLESSESRIQLLCLKLILQKKKVKAQALRKEGMLENQSMLERLSGSTFHLELEERDELKRVSWRRQRQDKPEYNGTKVSGHMAGGCEADNDEERNHGSTRAVPLTDVPPRQGMSSVSSAILYSENLDDIDVPDWRVGRRNLMLQIETSPPYSYSGEVEDRWAKGGKNGHRIQDTVQEEEPANVAEIHNSIIVNGSDSFPSRNEGGAAVGESSRRLLFLG